MSPRRATALALGLSEFSQPVLLHPLFSRSSALRPDPHPLSFDQQPFNRAFSTSSRSIRMISIELLDMRSPSMLYFRVFANRQSGKSPDSFLGLSPIPRPRFANSFACHRSKNSPVSPAI